MYKIINFTVKPINFLYLFKFINIFQPLELFSCKIPFFYVLYSTYAK